MTARQVQSLFGQKLSIRNIAVNAAEEIEIKTSKLSDIESGWEGYGLRALHRHKTRGEVHAFLKIFKQDVPARHERSEFLVRLGLAKHHEWAFQGVPYGWLNKQRVNGVEIVGHLTKFIGLQYGQPARDFRRIREEGQWDTVSADDRRAYAAQLASAVSALERLNFVHGDLSPGNIMIGPGPNGRTVCCLVDFDAFYHPSQPLIPRQFEGMGIRPLGNPEYRYPELILRSAADPDEKDEAIFVETDKFALAVLICELTVWNSQLADRLGRPQLLDEKIILSRRLSDIPDDVKNQFSRGFSLLEKALNAGDVDSMPTATDWLNVLGIPSLVPLPFRSPPQVIFYRKKGTTRKFHRHAVLSKKTSDHFGAVHPELACITFNRDDANHLVLTINTPLPAAVRRAGSQRILTTDAKSSLAILPGDLLRIAEWEISFEESPTQ
jgi:serine/threonine protein kinase